MKDKNNNYEWNFKKQKHIILWFRWNTFFPDVLSSVTSVIILVLVGTTIKQFIIVNSWIMLIIAAGITAILGLIINMFIVLSREERNFLLKLFKKKLKIA